MHEFVVVSTFFTVAAAFESVVVRQLTIKGDKANDSAVSKQSDTNNSSAPGDVALEVLGEKNRASKDANPETRGGRGLGDKLLSTAKHIDRASLVGFPVVYAAYTGYVFGPSRGGS
jgi:hypothetical protein|tara:strand:+ start:7707 stop:8054 length:348 start_codon:yes stop_codon:yes gene_type:complete